MKPPSGFMGEEAQRSKRVFASGGNKCAQFVPTMWGEEGQRNERAFANGGSE